jgi:hypothetical protein
LDVLAEDACILQVALGFPDILTNGLEASSIRWLLEISTDPEAFLTTVSLFPQVEWPLDLDVSDMLFQLCDIFTSCIDVQGQVIPLLEEKASACTLALSHLYCGSWVLQAYPGCSEFLGCGRRDHDIFLYMGTQGMCTADNAVLATTMNLCLMEDEEDVFLQLPVGLQVCPDSIPEWLSYILPYHFVTGRMNEEGENSS